MALSRTVSETRRHKGRKSLNLPTPVVFHPPLGALNATAVILIWQCTSHFSSLSVCQVSFPYIGWFLLYTCWRRKTTRRRRRRRRWWWWWRNRPRHPYILSADGEGDLFIIIIFFFLSFFRVNKCTAKTSQCTEMKLGTQKGYWNVMCTVILILLP